MKSSSNIKPNILEPDFGTKSGGTMDILLHWDIVEKQGETPDGQPYPFWEYQEERINIDIPIGTNEEITAYINANADRWFKIVGISPTSEQQWRNDIELALLDLAGV